MNPHDIKAALAKKGHTQTSIGKRLGVSQTAVRYVIFSERKSRRIEQAIIDATGLSGHRLWPRRYSRGSTSNVA